MVQFPIVLLFVAPLLLVISLFSRNAWRTWAGAALLLMALGAFGAWLAVASGHAAGQLVDKTPALVGAVAGHEAAGILTRTVFTILTALFALILAFPAMIRKALPTAARITVHAVFLVAYVACTLTVVNTAYQGGRLVHEFGVKAIVDAPSPQAAVVDQGPAPAGAPDAASAPKPASVPPAGGAKR
jgi:uncharacterized membrane protein